MLKKSIQFLGQIRRPGLRLERCEQPQENPSVPAATTDQDTFDKKIAELRLAVSTPQMEEAQR